MSEDKENLTENIPSDDIPDKTDKSEYIVENSTIFTARDDKTVNDKKPSTGSKKRKLIALVSLVLVAALAAGIFCIIKFGPGDSGTSSTDDGTIKVISLAEDMICGISVDGEKGKAEYSRANDDSDENGYIWSVDGVDAKYTLSSSISQYADVFRNISAIKEVSYTDPADCGFDAPIFCAKVTCTDPAKNYTVTVGKSVPAANGRYVSFGDDGKCYILSSTVTDEMNVSPLSFGNTAVFKGIDPDQCSEYYVETVLTYFDYISISGTKFSKDIRMISVKDDPAHSVYYMTSPANRIVDATTLDGYLSMFSDGFSATGIYSYSSTAEELKEYGLDAPQAVFSMKLGAYLITLKVGNVQPDGSYPVLFNDNTPIYKFSADSIAMNCVSYAAEDYVSVNTIMDSISVISSFRYMADGFDKTIKLAHDPSDANTWSATCGTVDMDIDSVKYTYQHIILAAPLVTTFEADYGQTFLKIIVSYTDGSPDKVLEYAKYNDSTRRYVLKINGQVQGIIANDRVENILNAAKTVCDGGKIDPPKY